MWSPSQDRRRSQQMPRFDSRLGCSTISFQAPAAAARRWRPSPASASPRSTSAHCPASATTSPTSSTMARRRGRRAHRHRVRAAGPLHQRRHRRPQRSPRRRARAAGRRGHLDMLVALAVATDARALVLPCGAMTTHRSRRSTTDLDRVADELVVGRPRRRLRAASSCGPSRCTSIDCAGTSNARSCSPIASPTTSAS